MLYNAEETYDRIKSNYNITKEWIRENRSYYYETIAKKNIKELRNYIKFLYNLWKNKHDQSALIDFRTVIFFVIILIQCMVNINY